MRQRQQQHSLSNFKLLGHPLFHFHARVFVIFLFGTYFRCKLLQENQAVAWFLKTKVKPRQNKKPCFLRNDCAVCIGWGRKQKTNEKPGRIQGKEPMVGFLRQKKDCAYTLRKKRSRL
jgi:hypothetical protein